MNGKQFIVPIAKTTVTLAQSSGIDLLEITAPSSPQAIAVLKELHISQKTEAGDAAAEQLHLQIKRGIGATAGSGGTAITPVPVQSSGSTASTTAKRFNTTPATAGSGSLTTLLETCVPVQQGYSQSGIDFTFRPGEICVVSLGSAIADDIDFVGYAIFQEVTSTAQLDAVA